MLRFQPGMFAPLPPCFDVTENGPDGSDAIDQITREGAQRHSQGKRDSEDPHDAEHAQRYAETLQSGGKHAQKKKRGIVNGEHPGAVLQSAGRPIQQAREEQEVREKAQRIRPQAFAVTPEPVFGAPGSAPTAPLPALQGDPCDPSCTLSNGSPHGARKVFARSHQRVVSGP